jgi:hypothetical protein
VFALHTTQKTLGEAAACLVLDIEIGGDAEIADDLGLAGHASGTWGESGLSRR